MERTSFSHRTVFVGLLVSLFGAAVVAGYIYHRYVRYVPVATRLVPPGATLVVRLEVEQAVVYQPFRTFVLPLLERGRKAKESREKGLERVTSLELAVDAREIVYAEFPNNEWSVLVGGMFRRDGVLSGVRRMMGEEGVELREEGDMLIHQSGISFAVSEGGTLVLASSAELLGRTLTVSQPEIFGEALKRASFAFQSRGAGDSPLGLVAWVVPADPFLLAIAPSPELSEEESVSEKLKENQQLKGLLPVETLQFERASATVSSFVSPVSRLYFDGMVRSLGTRIAASLEKTLKSSPSRI